MLTIQRRATKRKFLPSSWSPIVNTVCTILKSEVKEALGANIKTGKKKREKK